MKKGGGKKKGSKFELDVAHKIADHFNLEYGIDIRRTPGSGSLMTRADLWISDKERHRFPWFVECKKRENWSFDSLFLDITNNGYLQAKNWGPITWFNDAACKVQVDPTYDSNSPVALIFTKNRFPWFVLIEDKNVERVAGKEIVKIADGHKNFYLYEFEYFLFGTEKWGK